MHYYTCETIHLPDPVLEVPYAYTATAKNIYNSTLYIIKQIISAYEQVKSTDPEGNIIKSYIIKADLHDNILQTLELVNFAIYCLNDKQQIKQDKLITTKQANKDARYECKL